MSKNLLTNAGGIDESSVSPSVEELGVLDDFVEVVEVEQKSEGLEDLCVLKDFYLFESTELALRVVDEGKLLEVLSQEEGGVTHVDLLEPELLHGHYSLNQEMGKLLAHFQLAQAEIRLLQHSGLIVYQDK